MDSRVAGAGRKVIEMELGPSGVYRQRDLDRWEVWRTPGHVVEQGLWAARLLADVQAARVLDLGAGSGVFGQRTARVYAGAERFAVEVRADERRYLRRHYHAHEIADMFAAREQLRRHRARLVVSNPPYTRALHTLRLALDLVGLGGHVLLFLRSTFGSSQEAWQALREVPPVAEFSVAGRPNMRTGTSAAGNAFGGDFVPHTWFLWRRGYRPRRPAWVRHALPPLASEDLEWRVLPGAEAVTPEFPPHYLPEAAC